ncbi:RICIN domain-containing protein [Streptomyces sp. NPDC049687]|uniref:RICIN domain-containing protein n=1 Tax=Streptomyces sp. NPDC049687 TaxID=3365596 RepID=UPI0037BDDC13
MKKPLRKILAGLTGVLAVAGLTVANAPSAQAAPQSTVAAQGIVWEIWNNYNGLFLDADSGRNVYTYPRNNGTGQLWAERAGDRRSNVATGECLNQSSWGGDVGTYPCSTLDTEKWVHESHPGGVVIRLRGFPYCLSSGDKPGPVPGSRLVTTEVCAPDKKQLWSVRAVF